MLLGQRFNEVIAESVDFYFAQGGEQSKGNQLVYEAARRAERRGQWPKGEVVRAGRMIAEGVRYTKSIDNFIRTHSDKEAIKGVAKVAIAFTILNAERDSALWIDGTKGRRQFRSEDAVRTSWLDDFFGVLQDGIIEQQNLDKIFEGLTIINFNYDRCVEHFLFQVMRRLFTGKDERDIGDLMSRTLKISHPYGSVGKLPWEGHRDSEPVEFGADPTEVDLLALSDRIRTFNEEIEEGEELRAMRQALRDADRIVFLGSHFHKQNMELLATRQPEGSGGRPDVYATAFRRPEPDKTIIRRRISGMLAGRGTVVGFSQSCAELLSVYATTLIG